MEALGAAASVVGIISLGIQLAQILQKQIEGVRDADKRLTQIVFEIKATTACLSRLRNLLQVEEEKRDYEDRILNERASQDISGLVERCHVVLRDIISLVADSGQAALAAADEWQRDLQKPIRGRKASAELKVKLSSLEHLQVPWKMPKIEQCIADLDRLKSSILFLLAVAELGEKKRRSLKDKHSSSK